MKILEWYDLVAISFLSTLSQFGAGIGGIPWYGNIVRESLSESEMWLVRIMFGSVSILVSLLFWHLSQKIL